MLSGRLGCYRFQMSGRPQHWTDPEACQSRARGEMEDGKWRRGRWRKRRSDGGEGEGRMIVCLASTDVKVKGRAERIRINKFHNSQFYNFTGTKTNRLPALHDLVRGS